MFRIGNTERLIISQDGLVTSQYQEYNISIVVNGETQQPNGPVQVKIPIPDNYNSDACIVLHEMDDGSWRIEESVIEDGFIVFVVDHFSNFALADMTVLSHEHRFGSPCFTWNPDFSCVAAVTCEDCNHVTILDCSIGFKTINPKTNQVGEKIYTATTEYNGQTYEDTKTKIITLTDVRSKGTCGESMNWELLYDGTLYIFGSGEMTDYYIGGMDGVISLGSPWYLLLSSSITSINITGEVTSIGSNAFNGCSNVTSINMPDTITQFGFSAFDGCSKLTKVTLPSSLKRIDSSAFSGCTKLSEIVFQGDAPKINSNAFYNVKATAYYPARNTTWTEEVMQSYGGTITWVPYTSVAEVASGWSGETQWTLTDDGVLTFSGEGKMKNYGYNGGQPWLNKGVDITNVIVTEGVTGIGSGAFRNLTTLKSVTLPETLTRMGEAAFYGSGLESVEIPASLWTIQPYTFKNCANLTSVTFHKGNLQKISDGAFYGTGLTEVVLPDCLDILDTFAFKGCSNLASITIGSGLTELREAVFYGTAIPTITIPEGITKIGPYAFKNCVKLETVEMPTTLTSVGESAFYADTALKVVALPDGVTTIGNYAFRKCSAIETLKLSSELVTVGECAFYGCTSLTELVIPDKVTTIKPYAFKTCTGLTSVTLGNKVATIGEGAFNTCTGLKTIVFPASLNTIGGYCFSGSNKLWKLTFQGDAPAIGTGAFKGMNGYAYYPSGNTTWTADVMQNYGGTITWKAQN